MKKRTTLNIKKTISFLLIIVICVHANTVVAFAQPTNSSEIINYTMSGSDIIEKMMFIDTDGAQVSMKRVIHANGTAELTTTKNGDSSIANLTNHDYNIFYILANPNSKEARENTHIEANRRGGDLIGSQYKHVLLSSNAYTVTNTSVKQIVVGGVSTAAGILMGALGLPGATAVAIGSLLYTVISALSPYKVVVSQKLYEVFFSYDNVYYTHCYHEILQSYDTGNHLMETRAEFHQAVGG